MPRHQQQFSDQEILDQIRAGGATMERMIAHVYQRYWPMIRDFVQKQNGTEEEAEEVYQEGMIAFYENVTQGKFKGKSSLTSYLFSICKFTWHSKFKQRLRKTEREISWEGMDPGEASFLGKLMEKDEYENALNLLEKLGESCKNLLVYVHYFNYSMKEIAQMMGYKSDQIARNKHYRCNKSLEGMLAGNTKKSNP